MSEYQAGVKQPLLLGPSSRTLLHCVLYRGKLLRKKTFTRFDTLWLPEKAFSIKCWGVVSFGGTRSNPQKFSPWKYFHRKFTKVFPCESFPLYEYFKHIATYKLLYRWTSSKGRAHSNLHRCIRYLCIYQEHINPVLIGSLALWRFERGNVGEICDGIIIDFHTGLSHMLMLLVWSTTC